MFRLSKIYLRDFVDTLLDIYNSGADYIDIVGQIDDNQDIVSIEVKSDYISEREELTDDLINGLI
jgi:hypothetical protein